MERNLILPRTNHSASRPDVVKPRPSARAVAVFPEGGGTGVEDQLPTYIRRLYHRGKETRTMNVVLRIKSGPYIADGRPTQRAMKEYEQLSARLDSFKDFAADKLLVSCNENRTSGPVDRAGFIACLTEPTINLGDKLGSAVIWFDAGVLFGGLLVEVQVEKGEATGARVVG
jgi:hypothetical protein